MEDSKELDGSQQESTDKVKRPTPSFISKISTAILISAVASIVPFMGYSYLRGYLMGLGFDSPVISPSPYELVYFFFVGTGQIITQLLISTQFIRIVLLVTATYLIGYVLLTIAVKVYGEKVEEGNEGNVSHPDLGKWCRERVLESAVSGRAFFVNGLLVLGGSLAIAPVGVIIIVTILVVPWSIGYMGVQAGYEQGEQDYRNGVCRPVDWGDFSEDIETIRSCTEIVLDDEEIKVGHKAYETADRIYFVTNTEALEISKSGSIISKKKYLVREYEDE